jgi:hypothetical protein
MLSAALFFAAPDALAIPKPSKTPAVSRQSAPFTPSFSCKTSTNAKCGFDPIARRLVLQEKGNTYLSPELQIPSSNIANYLGIIACRGKYTVLITEQDLVVTLGPDAIRNGKYGLPNRSNVNGVSIDIMDALTPANAGSVRVRPVSWAFDESTLSVFILGSTGMLVSRDIDGPDKKLWRTDLPDIFKLPTSTNPPILYPYQGALFILQFGSNTLFEVTGIPVKVESAPIFQLTRHKLRAPCPHNPRFSTKSDKLVISIRAHDISISRENGFTTVRLIDSSAPVKSDVK